MSSKIDFDKSDFKLTGVQDNVVFIENQLWILNFRGILSKSGSVIIFSVKMELLGKLVWQLSKKKRYRSEVSLSHASDTQGSVIGFCCAVEPLFPKQVTCRVACFWNFHA